MIGLLTTFMAGPWGVVAKIATVVAIVAAIWFAGVRFEHNRMLPKLEAAKSEAELWQKTAENRKILIEAQNKAVEGLKASADLRISTLRNKLAVANSEASKFRDMAEKRENAVLNLPLSDDECTALKQLVDEARK
jgi:hypothetical protein